MKTASALLLLLLAGCQGGDEAGDNQAVSIPKEATPAKEARPAGESAGLTGLYEGGRGEQKDQLCIIDEENSARFGLVVWGSELHSCSGSGTAAQEGDRLRLTMAGDSSCAIDAEFAGGTVTLPANLPEGCNYYCGARARLSGATFSRSGATAEAAMQAKDLVGEPLCGTQD